MGLEQTGAHQKAEEEKANREQSLKEDEEASKHWISHPFKASEARSRVASGSSGSSHGIPDIGSTFNGQKVISVKRIK